MRKASWIAVVGMTIAIAGATLADTGDDAKEVVERVLKAAGGWERLSQAKAYTYKDNISLNSQLPESPNKSTFYVEPPNKYRLEEETQKDGKPVKYIEVVNGGKGWATRDGERQELPASAIARTFDPQEGWGYKVILRLKDPQTVVTTIGDSVIGDHDVYGLKLTRSTGRTTIASRMWFDKKTWLLVRSEWLTNQANVLMEVNWDDYRMIDGIAVPHRATSKSFAAGGGGYTHVFSDFKFVDKFDPKLFDVP